MKEQNQDINSILQVRRDKLSELRSAGKGPFVITKYDQTHHTDEVRSLYEELETKLLAGRKSVSVEGMDEQQARLSDHKV